MDISFRLRRRLINRKADGSRLLRVMYYQNGLPCLRRKKEQARDLLGKIAKQPDRASLVTDDGGRYSALAARNCSLQDAFQNGHVAEPGRRAGFRILSRKGWGFKSLHAHVLFIPHRMSAKRHAGVAQW